MIKSKYNNVPIESLNSLSRLLSIETPTLLMLAAEANEHYFPNEPEIKSDGRIRQTYRVSGTLTPILKKINKEIFESVTYPYYLQGSIKDFENPRSYIINAAQHAGKSFIIHEDIQDFFPSIKSNFVLEIWQNFFKFPDSVARVLTSLTTYNAVVPQGANTSGYLANLVFWDKEPEIEFFCRQKDYVYTRYVDDIVISSEEILSKTEQFSLTTKIYGMLFSKHMRPNRSKRKVFPKNRQMSVTGLNVNSHKPTINKSDRYKIRAAVYECEKTLESERTNPEYRKLFERTKGRVLYLKQLHPKKGKKYLERLMAVPPLDC